MNTPEQNQIRLMVLLDAGYPELASRVRSGDLVINFGEEIWPTRWYRDPYFNRSVPMVLEMASHFPEIKTFTIYYFKDQDFHRIRFWVSW